MESFKDIHTAVSPEEANTIFFIDALENIAEINVSDALRKVDSCGKDNSFIYGCIEYMMEIKPERIGPLLSLFFEVNKKYEFHEYYIEYPRLINTLKYGGIIPKDACTSDPYDEFCLPYIDFPLYSLEKAIFDDNVSNFIKITSHPSFDPTKTIKYPDNHLIFTTLGINKFTYSQMIVYFNAIKCFKYAYLNNILDFDDVSNFAIAGGNLEIIHLIEQKGISFNNCMMTAVMFHRHSLCDWLLNNYECQQLPPSSCQLFYNQRAYLYFKNKPLSSISFGYINNINQCIENCDIASIAYSFKEKEEKISFLDDILIKIVTLGSIHLLRYLVEECNINPKQVYTYNEIPLLNVACDEGYFSIVKYLIEACKCDACFQDKFGMNALHSAARKGRLNIVKYLVEKCAVDPNISDGLNETALHYAAVSNQLEIVKYLVEKCHVNIEAASKNNWTPLMLAAACNNMPVIEYLVDTCGANINKKNNNKESVIYCAASNGNYEATKFLAEREAKITSKDINNAKTAAISDLLKEFKTCYI